MVTMASLKASQNLDYRFAVRETDSAFAERPLPPYDEDSEDDIKANIVLAPKGDENLDRPELQAESL